MLYFEKYQGTGNDFIIINGLDCNITYPNQLAISICDRHYGVGADGLMIVKEKDQNLYMDFYNADGTIAPMCGNGIRCFAKYLYQHELVKDDKFIISTLAGLMKVELIKNDHDIEEVKINMGHPSVISVNQEITVLDQVLKMSVLTMGTLHGVIFLESLDDYPLSKYAPLIEQHEMFPNRINVNFCEVVNESTLKVITYERGVGFTKSCGTGSSAVAVISKMVNHTDNKVNVFVSGGKLTIEQINQNVYLLGPSEFICCGYYREGGKNETI